MNLWGHFKTITRHRHMVMRNCFRVGLYKQGLLHDLSKYMPTEFLAGAKYYQGTRSPNAAQREDVGYSEAWMHHKGRNRHHFEYWTDLVKDSHRYEPVPMPYRYVVESVMDRIAASKVYKGDRYYAGCELDYLGHSMEAELMHPQTKAQLVELLTMLKEQGEDATFAHIRKTLK